MQFAAVIAISGFLLFFFQADLRVPKNRKKGGGKASSYRETGGTYPIKPT